MLWSCMLLQLGVGFPGTSIPSPRQPVTQSSGLPSINHRLPYRIVVCHFGCLASGHYQPEPWASRPFQKQLMEDPPVEDGSLRAPPSPLPSYSHPGVDRI